MTPPVPRPSCHRIDHALWSVVATRSGHLQLVACLVLPLIVGLWLPETPGWLSIYLVLCVVNGALVVVVQRSRDRWLAWLEYLRRSPR
jgi:hypothetical protein